MDLNQAASRIKRVHDIEGMTEGSDSTRSAQNADWERCVGIVHHGHPYYGGGDANWVIKSAGAGRPPTNEAAVHLPDRNFWDFWQGIGADNYSWNEPPHHLGILNPPQELITPRPPQQDVGPWHNNITLGAGCFVALGIERDDPNLMEEICREYVEEGGVKFVRVILHTPRTNSDGVTPGIFKTIGVEWTDSNFIDLIHRLDDRFQRWGLKWAPTYTAGISGMETSSKRLGMCDKVAEAFRDRPNRREYDEMANEKNINGMLTEYCQEMARRVRSHGQVEFISLSSPDNVHSSGSVEAIHEEVRQMQQPCPESNAMTPHWNRAWNRPPSLGPYAAEAKSCGEPIGPKSSVDETDDPLYILGTIRAAVRAGYRWYVLHSDSAFCSNKIPQFTWPDGSPKHGFWAKFTDHHNGRLILNTVRDYLRHGTIPADQWGDSGGGNGGGGNGGGGGDDVLPYEDPKSVEFGHGINKVHQELERQGRPVPQDPGMISVKSQRCAWDYYSGNLPWEEAKNKHLNDYAAEYGLPPIF